MFYSLCSEVDICETGHVRGRSIAILKKLLHYYYSTFMDFKNFFIENLQLIAIDLSEIFKGMLQSIFCNNIKTNSDRK